MSLVQIVNHDEVIYSILNKPPPDPPKSPRFQSQLEKELKAAKVPQLRRNFGYAEVLLKPPDQYLKKGEGITHPRKIVHHNHYTTGNLPPVPRCPPPQKELEKKKVNFRVQNIKKVIKAKPKSVEPRIVDTRYGHTKKIKGSGQAPEFCLREDFGRMPTYLINRNRRIQRACHKKQETEEHHESLCKLIAEEERQKLLADLKHNWELMQKAFLQLPMLTDTIPKILKKTKMEQELKQLEKDIALVESNPYIYVFDE